MNLGTTNCPVCDEVLESYYHEFLAAGWLAPDSAARLREFARAELAYCPEYGAEHLVEGDEPWNRYVIARKSLTYADLGIETEETK